MRIPQTALDDHVRRYAFVREKIERLQRLADDHFGHDPDAIHWGHVGDLGRVEQALEELLAVIGGKAQ
ncbi:MAG: hypothetical protein ING59_14645 [Burkholderiales bacterium]|jgi:hypothetical protein|nr:hypothetical protein [Burkholderiales bacterium]